MSQPGMVQGPPAPEEEGSATGRVPIVVIVLVLTIVLVLGAMVLQDDSKVVDCTTATYDPRTGEVLDVRSSVAAANPGQRPRNSDRSVTTCDD